MPSGRSTEPLAASRSKGLVSWLTMARPTVEAFLAALPDAQVEVAQAIRRLVREAVPDAGESIKWSQLVFESNGPFVAFRGHSGHATLTFWRGAELAAGHVRLEGAGERMRHVRFKSVDDVSENDLRALMGDAAALNREHGDPTRRP